MMRIVLLFFFTTCLFDLSLQGHQIIGCVLPSVPFGTVLSVYGQRMPDNVIAPYSFIMVTCAFGYEMRTGINQAYCTRDGSWSATVGCCYKHGENNGMVFGVLPTTKQPIRCIVPIVANGYLTADRYRAPFPLLNFDVECGTQVTLTCEINFEVDGSSQSECQRDGTWSNRLGRCVVIAPPITLPPLEGCDVPEICNGFVSINGGPKIETKGFLATVYSTIRVFCKPGYALDGNDRSSCVCNKEWSNEIGKCVPEITTTPKPTPPREMWCLLPDIPNGRYLSTSGDRIYGSYVLKGMSAVLCCDVGYNLQGDDTAMCANGEWFPSFGSCRSIWQRPTTTTPAPTTTKSQCSLPREQFGRYFTVEGQMLTVNSVASGTAVILRCNPGCEAMDGSRSAVCIQGRFSPELGRCYRQSGLTCTIPSGVDHARFFTNQGIEVTSPTVNDGAQITMACSSGYMLDQGASQAFCNNGVWTARFGMCRYVYTPAPTTQSPQCVLPNNARGQFFYASGQPITGVSVGDGVVVILRCDPGYDLDPSNQARATCNRYEWSAGFGQCRRASTCGSSQKIKSIDLVVAARSGNLPEVRNLLTNNADPNSQDTSGWTSLMWAANNNFPAVINQLLDCGATVDLPNSVGSTALLFAAKGGFVETTRLLLERGANPNTVNNFGSTALAFAAQKGETDVVQVLLFGRADVNAKDNDGATALFWAVRGNYTETVKRLLLGGANPNTPNKSGSTSLMAASKGGYLAIVKSLLDQGADPNIVDLEGNSALSLADGYGQTDVANWLLQNGAVRRSN